MAQCNLCVTDFWISSRGCTDVRRHQESWRKVGYLRSHLLGEYWGAMALLRDGAGVEVCPLGESNEA